MVFQLIDFATIPPNCKECPLITCSIYLPLRSRLFSSKAIEALVIVLILKNQPPI